MSEQIDELQCKVCEWKWKPRNPDVTPDICPKCKSRYWNVGRQRSAAKDSTFRVTNSAHIGYLGEADFALYLRENTGWQPRSLSQDLGEDLVVDIYEDGASAGLAFYCQIKSSPNLDKYRLKNGDLSYPIPTKDLRHWTDYFPPVVLVLWDVTQHSGYWVTIAEAIRNLDALSPKWKKANVAKVRVPSSNSTSPSDLKKLQRAVATQLMPAFAKGNSLTATMSLSFPHDDEGKAQQEAFRRFVQLGEAVTIQGKYIEGIKFSPWYARKFGEAEIDRTGQIVLGPRHSDKVEDLRLTLINPTNRILQTEQIQVKAVRVGDEQITFTNEHDPKPFFFRMVYQLSGHVTITVSLRNSVATAAESLRAFKFFELSHGGGVLRVNALTHPDSWGALSRFELPINKDSFPSVDPQYRALLEKMRDIEEAAAVKFTLTDVGISDEEKKSIEQVAAILKGQRDRREFKREIITLNGPRGQNDVETTVRALLQSWRKKEKVDLKSESRETSIEILGTQIHLGRQRVHISAFLADESAASLKALLEKPVNLNRLEFILVDGVHEEEFLDWIDGPAELPEVEDVFT